VLSEDEGLVTGFTTYSWEILVCGTGSCSYCMSCRQSEAVAASRTETAAEDEPLECMYSTDADR
jgi:hypothetical protein